MISQSARRERPGSTRYSIPVSTVRSADVISSLVGWIGRDGGDEETRTPDPLLAKEMLFQLSYAPFKAFDHRRYVVGVSGLEPETSALSGQCSNQLS